MKRERRIIGTAAACLAGAVLAALTACGAQENGGMNLIGAGEENARSVVLFSPMEKTDPNAENAARSATDKTVLMAEKLLGVEVKYTTYTAENYQERTYDQVAIDRIRSDMDDIYLLNPDVILAMGEEGRLVDLSGLESAENLREVVKTANVVDGKLVAIPQEVVAYGLFLNRDMFDRYGIRLPETPEDFLECCRIFQENGIETPVGANRWWLETFVFAQAYADLYNGENTEAEIAAWEAAHPDPNARSLEQLRADKLAELSRACGAAITAGCDVVLPSGGGGHISLTAEDQINLTNAAAAVEGGAAAYPYHLDGGLCALYPAADIRAMARAATAHKLYHTTYYNHLAAWVRRCETAEELAAITYGAALPPDLEDNMGAILAAAAEANV